MYVNNTKGKAMKQSRLGSLIETIINTLIGFLGSVLLVWPFAAWITGIPYTGGQQFWVVVIFTVWSISRGYAVRRWVNHHIHSASTKLAKLLLA